MTQRQTRCIDCNAMGRVTDRPAMKPGPRCEQHHNERKRAVSKASHGNRIAASFGMDSDTYDELYGMQREFIATQTNWSGKQLTGVCYGCGKAKGEGRRRLAVDHDHRCAELYGTDHAPETGCPKCWRALLCAYCNEILGRLDAGALRRLIEVVEDPPAQRLLFNSPTTHAPQGNPSLDQFIENRIDLYSEDSF